MQGQLFKKPEMPVGTRVGAERWPYHAAHPDCWGKPLAGTVLDKADPRAWAGSLAFPGSNPDPKAVRAHVERQEAAGFLQDGKVPVAWDFGKVYWERTEKLRTYEADVAAWWTELNQARAKAA
jgi:hypothetical protein